MAERAMNRGSLPDGEGGRCFRVVTEEFPDRIEVRVEEQEWVENFGWISRGDPHATVFGRFCIAVPRRPHWLARLLACLHADRVTADAFFQARFRRRLERALVDAQVEANRRNWERRLVHHHLETVRDVLEP
jgi:hypothetical protein